MNKVPNYDQDQTAKIKDTPFYMGNTPVSKSYFTMTVQKALKPADPSIMDVGDQMVDNHQALMPHSHGRNPGMLNNEEEHGDGNHKHFGHPTTHPQRLRHRKISADPVHAEEDKLVDEWKDLYDKAQQGQCTPLEMQRFQEIRGRIDEINASRSSDAEKILGIAMKSLDRAESNVTISMLRRAELALEARELLSAMSLAERSIARVVASDPGTNEMVLEMPESTQSHAPDVEYGDDDIGDENIIPNNEGFDDQFSPETTVWDTVADDERVYIAYPDTVEKKSQLAKAAQITDTVLKYFDRTWGQLEVKGDDGRFSSPLFYDTYMSKDGPSPEKAKQMLRDNSANGQPLSDKQKGLFGAIAGGNSNTSKGGPGSGPKPTMVDRPDPEEEKPRIGHETLFQPIVKNNLPMNPLKTNAKPLNKEPRMNPTHTR